MTVKIQTYKLLCEYRFKPTLLFYDFKNQIGNGLFPNEYKHWRTDGLKITLSDYETRTVLSIEHNRLVLEIDVPDSVERFQTTFSRAFKQYTERVTIDTYLRIGIRTQSLVPVEFKFPELVSITQERLLSQDKRLLEIVGSRVDDYMYNVITTKSGRSLHVVCGPVRKQEIPRWYQPAEVTTDPDEKAKELTYPEVALFIDCDLSVPAPNVEVVQDFLDKGIREVTQLPAQLAEHLLGE